MLKNPKVKEGEGGIFLFISGSSDTAEIFLNRSYKVHTETQGGAGPEALRELAAETLAALGCDHWRPAGSRPFSPEIRGPVESGLQQPARANEGCLPADLTP